VTVPITEWRDCSSAVAGLASTGTAAAVPVLLGRNATRNARTVQLFWVQRGGHEPVRESAVRRARRGRDAPSAHDAADTAPPELPAMT
jgi:hypothetical protein